MIPNPEEVLSEYTYPLWEEKEVIKAMKEYGRRLLDHVAEKAKEDGNLLTIWQILKIKDGL